MPICFKFSEHDIIFNFNIHRTNSSSLHCAYIFYSIYNNFVDGDKGFR